MPALGTLPRGFGAVGADHDVKGVPHEHAVPHVEAGDDYVSSIRERGRRVAGNPAQRQMVLPEKVTDLVCSRRSRAVRGTHPGSGRIAANVRRADHQPDFVTPPRRRRAAFGDQVFDQMPVLLDRRSRQGDDLRIGYGKEAAGRAQGVAADLVAGSGCAWRLSPCTVTNSDSAAWIERHVVAGRYGP